MNGKKWVLPLPSIIIFASLYLIAIYSREQYTYLWLYFVQKLPIVVICEHIFFLGHIIIAKIGVLP